LFSKRLEWLGAAGPQASLREGLRGVEKETLRVDRLARLAQTPHPRGCGSPLTHPSITTDYSEALLELVTPPATGNWQTLQQIFDIHAFVYRQIDDELLWPMSMPCELSGDDSIPIASYGPSNQGMFRTVYRRGLGHRYGRAMQAIAGVHFNYSPPAAFWPAFQEFSGNSDAPNSFRSAAMMGLVRNYYRHAWLVIYLFGASPAFAESFLPQGHELLEKLNADTWFAPYATSLRMSDIGYQNRSQGALHISANSLCDYVRGLTDAVSTPESRYENIGVIVDGEYRQLNANRLQIENEYYSTIRPKPPGSSRRTTAGLREHGVEYVEVRTLDISPADPVGMNQAQLRFLEVLLLYCLLSDSPAITADEQREIARRDLLAAREGRRPGLELPFGGGVQSIAEHANAIASPLLELAALLDESDDSYEQSVRCALEVCADPQRTPSAQLIDELRESRASFVEYSLDIARAHRSYFLEIPMESAVQARFEQLAAESLAAAAELEAQRGESFAAYLEKFRRMV
jgi:glutamate--cysteine ligase